MAIEQIPHHPESFPEFAFAKEEKQTKKWPRAGMPTQARAPI
ncbi:MAG TPA: hypothetical protein VJ385_18870 [Fibrobacteria bacterium]|nr:hypothetical protein [Fibrobacteria bacterium]